MTRLKLSQALYESLTGYIAAQPEMEVCGVLGGVWQPYDRLAVALALAPIENIAPRPEVSYHLHPEQQWRAMRDFERQGWEMIGIYHSHPTGSPHPSPSDISGASYPEAVYLIGVPGGEVKGWRIVRGQARAVVLDIGEG